MHRLPNRLKRIVLFTSFLLFLVFLVLEIVLRFVLGNFMIAPLRLDPGDGRCVGLVPNAAITYTGWWMRVPPVVHDTNRFGFRGPPYPESSEAADIRIAALGDSFTYGQGVAADQTIPAHLETALRKATSWDMEVLNFGVPGINLQEMIEQYRYFACRWNPDVVMAFLFENDLGAPLCYWSHHGRRMWFLRHLYTYRFLFILVLSKHVEEDYAAAHASGVGLSAQLREFKELAGHNGARFAVVVLGDPLHNQARFEDITRSIAVETLYLDAVRLREVERIRGDWHFSPKGNQWVAEAAAQWLLRSDLLQPSQ